MSEDALDAARAEAALARVLESRVFARSPRLRRFLDHVVREKLAGRADRLSGYAIGVDVFDRPPDFDPTTDTIVRVEARRLRQALDAFYTEEGAEDPIRISLPRGGYTPVLQASAPTTFASPAAAAISRPRHGPAIVVLPFEDYSGQGGDDGFANGLTEQLIATLSRFSELSVVSRTTAFAYRGVPVREIREALDVDYVFEGSIRRSASQLRLTAQFIDAETDTHLWSTTFDRPLADADLFEIEDDLASRVASRIADRYGPLGRVGGRASRRSGPSFDVYSALLKFHDNYARHDPVKHLEARAALLAALDIDPDFAEGWAALAAIHLDEHRFGFNPLTTSGTALERARAAASHAVILDPQCANGHLFLACAHFHAQDDDGFRSAAEEALRLNPGHSDLLADIGSCLVFLGEEEDGFKLLARAKALSPTYPGWYRFPAVIKAFEAGSFPTALEELQKAPMPEFFWWRAIKAAAHAQLNQIADAKGELRALIDVHPGFACAFSHEAKKWRVPEAVVASIALGLGAAGLEVT